MTRLRLLFLYFLAASLPRFFCTLQAQPATQLTPLNTPQLWQRLEFRVSNVPSAVNPFDPDSIRLDAEFRLPSGKAMTVPAFWYQAYQRGLSGGSESLSMVGQPEWRLRFTPPEAGSYTVSLTILTNGGPHGAPVQASFSVPEATTGPGYVQVAPSRQYFQTSDGQALRIIGANVCWHGGRGTYDYDTWFAAMQSAGENYARLWMWPSAFGLEADRNTLNRYRQDRAWQLDYVFQLAAQRGIYLLLCLDYHGMFEVTLDYWGGNNYWPLNPYNVTNGGPCLNQNGFFTNAVAQTIYQKRLRYLVARYGYSQNLLAWQFFNEIDNVYAYLTPRDVAAWHGVMGTWLHANDSYGHLVTTSLTGNSDRPEIWSLPQLDFTAYHSYGEPSPALRLSSVTQSFLQRYGKPVLVDEFGTDWRGWGRTNDPYLRGFRQGLWGGALGGSAGTAASWWWENIHSENVYPVYSALKGILSRTGWGRGTWTNISFRTSGAPPTTVGEVTPGGETFDAFLAPNAAWGGKPTGQLAIANATSPAYATTTLNGFVHGSAHPELRVPFRLSAWLTNNARLVLHLNSVSEGAVITVRVDGAEIYRTNLPNLDGGWQVNNEYNWDIPVALPAGKRLVEIRNAGGDWFFLDWVRVEQVLPADYAANWQASPDAIGLRGSHESLLYVVAPGAHFPAGATNVMLPVQHGQSVTLTNWPSGEYFAEWHLPATGNLAGLSSARTTNGVLTLPLPSFSEDLAGIIYSPPVLKPLDRDTSGNFQLEMDSETGGNYVIDASSDLVNWAPALTVTNETGTVRFMDFEARDNRWRFYRSRK